MKLHCPTAAALALGMAMAAASALADIPANYFNSVNESSPATLRTSLNSIITTGHTALGYNATGPAVDFISEDPMNSNNVLLIYTGQSRPKADRCTVSECSDSNAFTGLWTREHIFPQSTFSSAEPMRSDLHALFACDHDVNNRRGNDPYNFLYTSNYSAGGSVAGSSRFYPRQEDRGDVARALMYMDVRYEGGTPSTNLTLNDNPIIGTGNGQMGMLSTLIRWNCADLPDSWEVTRNNRAHDLQGNANPFIHDPLWAVLLYDGITPTDGDTLTVDGMGVAPAEIHGGVPAVLITVDLAASVSEYYIDSLTVTNTSSVANNQVDLIEIWVDGDSNGDVGDAMDTLVGSAPMTAGTQEIFTPTLAVDAAGSTILIAAKLKGTAPLGQNFSLRLDANGIAMSRCGGVDVPAAFAAIGSGNTLISVPPGSGEGVIISEIMYNPAGVETNGQAEWVEVFNTLGTPITLASPVLRDEDGSTSVWVSAPVTLQPGEAAVVINSVATAAVFRTAWNVPMGIQVLEAGGWSSAGFSLANSPTTTNEVLEVGQNLGPAWDVANYLAGAAGWPPSSNGFSIHVRPGSLDAVSNDAGANWALSAVGVNGAYATVATPSPYTQTDVGSPGIVVGASPAFVSLSDSGLTNTAPGTITVSFFDNDDHAAGVFTASVSGFAMGTAFVDTVTKTAAKSYEAEISYSPFPSANGNETFTFTVGDGTSTVNFAGLMVMVTGSNTQPTISSIDDQFTPEGTPIGPLNFTVGDLEDDEEDLVVYAESSNETVVLSSNIVLGGTGANRTVTITPETGESGATQITVFVEDLGGEINSTSFLLNVGNTMDVQTWEMLE